MKTCFKCGIEKPLSEFYRHPRMGDGYLGKCRECTRKDVYENRESKIEYYRKYDRERGNRQTYEYILEYRKRNPDKYKAVNAVNNAIRDKKLIKPQECSSCGTRGKVHAHHYDYSKPFDVIWLCPVCHKDIHKGAKNVI